MIIGLLSSLRASGVGPKTLANPLSVDVSSASALGSSSSGKVHPPTKANELSPSLVAKEIQNQGGDLALGNRRLLEALASGSFDGVSLDLGSDYERFYESLDSLWENIADLSAAIISKPFREAFQSAAFYFWEGKLELVGV